MSIIQVSWWIPGKMFERRWKRTFTGDGLGMQRALVLAAKLRKRGRAYNIVRVSQHG